MELAVLRGGSGRTRFFKRAVSGLLLFYLLLAPPMLGSQIVSVHPVYGSPGPTEVLFDPLTIMNASLVAGEQFSIDLTVDSVQNLFGYQFWLAFDPDVIHGVSVENGPFLGSAEGAVVVAPGPGFDNTEGELKLFGASIFFMGEPPPDEDLPDGGGVLATVTFEVVDIGCSNITLGPETGLQNKTGGWDLGGEHCNGWIKLPPQYPGGPQETVPYEPWLAILEEGSGFFSNEQYTLTIDSTPVRGIEFTLDGVSKTTLFSESLLRGSYNISVPTECTVGEIEYSFVNWDFVNWEGDSTNETQVIELTSDMSLTANYAEAGEYTLTIGSTPITGVEFTLDFSNTTVESYETPFSVVLPAGSYIVEMPTEWMVDETPYSFLKWEDDSTNETRVVALTDDMSVNATYVKPAEYRLKIGSTPISGVSFTLDGESQSTPFSESLLAGSYVVEMPTEWEVGGSVYDFHAWTDLVTTRRRTVTLTSNKSFTAMYILGMQKHWLEINTTVVGATPLENYTVIEGVNFTVDDSDETTPFSSRLKARKHVVRMPSECEVNETRRWFVRWNDTDSTNPTRVVDLTADMSLTAIYTNRSVHNVDKDTYYETIGEAVGNATADDTIEVYPKTYYENLFIDKPLKLIGKDPYTTVIDGGEIWDPIIYVTADNVTISGFTLQNSSWTGIYMEGIMDWGTGTPLDVVTGCIISNNIISNPLEDMGLQICEDNIISNNVLKTAELPMWLWASHNNLIYGNIFTSSPAGCGGDAALSLWESNNNRIYGNTFSNNSVGGLALWYCFNNTIYHNNFLHNGLVETVKSPTTIGENDSWASPEEAYSSDDAYASPRLPSVTYKTYGFAEIPGESVDKVEVGIEGYGDGDDYIEVQVSWDNGTSWTTLVSYTPPTSDANIPAYVNVTDGRTWTWDELNNTNFLVRIYKHATGSDNTIYIDWIPVKVTTNATTTIVMDASDFENDVCWSSPEEAYSSDDTYASTRVPSVTYSGYGFTEVEHAPEIVKVEVGVEGFCLDGDDYIEVQVSWDNGTSWTSPVYYVLLMSDSNIPVYLDVTDGRTWTWDELSDDNFLVRITKWTEDEENVAYVDWLTVKVTSYSWIFGLQAYDDGALGDNMWNADYPSGGNYWSDYTGVDLYSGENQDKRTRDGIGDTPYEIPDYSLDRYPLMTPWPMWFNVVWDDVTYPISIISNSTITAFKFSQLDMQISFNVTGPDGTTGFCEVKIPRDLLDASPDEWTILVDGTPVTPYVESKRTYNILSFTYTHSTKTIIIEGTIVVDNISPIANAEKTAPRTVDEDVEDVTFDGSASWDDIAIKNYTWTFEEDGNSTVLVGKSVKHKFETPGFYLVTLEVTDLRDNKDTDTVLITVSDITDPVADASGTNTTINEDTPLTLNGSLSSDNVVIIEYKWYVEDAPETFYDKEHEEIQPYDGWADPDVYNVTLKVWDAAGNSGTDTIWITVSDITPPVADASKTLKSIEEDTEATLDGTASSDNDPFHDLSYTWTFVDETPQTLEGNVTTYTFATPGVYLVTLNVSDAAENWNTTQLDIEVLDVTRPIADAGPSQIVYEDTVVTFDGSASWDNDPFHDLNYTWTFVDENETQTLEGNVTHPHLATYTFATPGDYVVTLNVTDAAGNWDIDKTIIVVRDATYPIAVADVSPSDTVDEGTVVTFNGSASTDNIGIVSYEWDFDDGNVTIMDVPIVNHTYAQPGVYTVTLKVTDGEGKSDTDTVVITVLDITYPVANAGVNQTVDEDTLVTFDGSNSTDNVGIESYTWAFTENSELRTLTGVSPNYIFVTPGVYVVTLNVTDAAGNSATDEVQVTVRDVTAPVADAGADLTVNEDTLVTLNGSASSDNNPVGIINYTWTFTDVTPQILEGNITTYTFATPGVYTITLNVIDAVGKWGIDTVVVTVVDVTDPVADAGPDQTVDANRVVTFNGSASTDNVGVESYVWTFMEDDTLRTLMGVNPNYPFVNSGNYTVTLKVTDAAGNFDTDTVTISVQSSGSIPTGFIVVAVIAVAATAIMLGIPYFTRERSKS